MVQVRTEVQNWTCPPLQMLVINQRVDKLAAARRDFKEHGMLEGSVLPSHLLPDGDLPPHTLDPQPPSLPVSHDNEGEEFGIIDEPESLSEIQLAKTYGTSWPTLEGH